MEAASQDLEFKITNDLLHFAFIWYIRNDKFEIMRHLFAIGCMASMIIYHTVSCQGNDQAMRFNIQGQWKFKQENTEQWYPADVPGCIHTDLMRSNIIPDPFFGINEQSMQWIGEKNWIYEISFDLSGEVLNKKVVELVFEGLDTYAEVNLNGSRILNADNMFRTWRIDCRSILREKQNLLVIRFRNVFDENVPKYKSAPFELQAFGNNDQADVKIAMYSRKAQFHYGWDWGPRLITCGIWRPVYFETWNDFIIRDVQVHPVKIEESSADIYTAANIFSRKDQNAAISISMDQINLLSDTIHLKPGMNRIELNGTLPNPQLWWTNGLGTQKLYNYQMHVKDDFGNEDTYTASIGIRSLKVVREKDTLGKSMTVVLNGVPVFMKGANYIPQDNFQNRVTDKRYEYIIRSAAEANMNMLRIWGGGIYEDDRFYELCDKYGILVWQDMIFACAMYPGNDEFFKNVRQEVIDNVIRMRNHPCMAIYCGNNENEAGWNQWGWKEKFNISIQREFEESAKKLFYGIIPSAVREADSTRYYHPTSPSAGFNNIPGSEGDIHYWGVWHGMEPFERYPANLGRFMSEYGFQSYPEFSSISRFAKPEDRSMHSEVMLSHQRCMADERRDKEYGNRLIQQYMDRWYRTPKDFESFTYVTQLLQAEGVKIAMEAHRCAMPFCMGSLYWQIDDCWPVASWSSIDYYGRWKALHYMAKKAFAPILISTVIKDDSVKINIVSDKRTNINAVLEISILDFYGKILFNKSIPVFIKQNSSENFFTEPASNLISDTDASQVALFCRLKDGNKILADNTSFFRTPKDLNLLNPDINKRIVKTDSGFEIELTTNVLAKNLYIDCDDHAAFYSDNYFDLLPGISRKVIVQTNIDQGKFERSLRIISLVDSYNN